MKKIISMLIICSVFILFSGCRKKVGFVKMDNVMTAHELYKQQDKYLGKVVTVVWDTTVIRGSGHNCFPDSDSLNGGKCYYIDLFALDDFKRIGISEKQYWDSVRSIIAVSKGKGCTPIDMEFVDLAIIRAVEENKAVTYPEWISDSVKNKYKILQIKDDLDDNWRRLGSGRLNWVTGVFIGFYKRMNYYGGAFEEDMETDCGCVMYTANILPLGFQYEPK